MILSGLSWRGPGWRGLGVVRDLSSALAAGVKTAEAALEGEFRGAKAIFDGVKAGAAAGTARADEPGPLGSCGEEAGEGGGEGGDACGVHQANRPGAVRSSMRLRVAAASGADAPREHSMRRGSSESRLRRTDSMR